MKAIEKAQAIYDLTMNERCEAKVQDLFSNGLHKLMIDLIEELEELENRSCDNCNFSNIDTYFTDYGKCEKGYGFLFNGNVEVIKDFCCNKWEKE